MAELRAQQIIAEQKLEESKAENFRALYQQVADYMMPREDQITKKTTPGGDKSINIYDPTAMLDLQDMVSGLSAAFFPSGQQSFGLNVKNKNLANIDSVKRYLPLASQITHDELFESNFMMNLNEALGLTVGFGTGCLFSEFVVEGRRPLNLNFKAWDVSYHTIKEDNTGRVDTVILKFLYTARQAVEKFGDNAGEEILKAVEKLETESNRFEFIHIVRPRIRRNVTLVDSLNMPFESVFVNVKEQIVVDEGGFEQMPFAVPRWMKSAGEKYGRGQGTIALSGVKTLQKMWNDHVEFGNKCVNPPREVLDSFEGTLRVTPGAVNIVRDIPCTKVMDLGAQNYQFGENAFKMQQDVIHRAFFVDVFAPLANLPGDRRTTVEIFQRVKQAMKKLALPVYRLQTELFAPVITRCVLLLIKHGRIPPPPAELRGQGFGIEFMGELALAMRDQQSRAFQQFAGLVGELEAVFPGSRDVINIDRALPDIALSFGVKVEHLSTEEEIAAKRRERQQQLAAQQALQAAQVGGDVYGKSVKAPESGSPAELLIGAAKGE